MSTQTSPSPDQLVTDHSWSDLSRFRPLPDINFSRMQAYRDARLKEQLRRYDAAMVLLHNPLSLRYACGYRTYGPFQARIATTYLFIPQEGPKVIHGVYGTPPGVDDIRPARPLSFFDGGDNLPEAAEALADDICAYLTELGTDNRRVALEYTSPLFVQALERRGLEVIDGSSVAEMARVIKSGDELECMRWAIAVAELGIAKVQSALRPGVTEQQLWGLLTYANLVNDGEWHEGRMLASGDRINPWLQEASKRKIEAGDLVGFDTDMVGPYGYFADVSRTLFCGPGQPSKRQKQLYRLALDEITHNQALLRPGLRFTEFQARAFEVPEEFHENAYTCVCHAVGMCDEWPRVNPRFRGPTPYDGSFEAGMVICVESYMGAVGERDGVKLEQQVLITDEGAIPLSSYPFDEALLG